MSEWSCDLVDLLWSTKPADPHLLRVCSLQPEQACLISSSISKYNKDVPGGLPSVGFPVPPLRRALSAGGNSSRSGGGREAGRRQPVKTLANRKRGDAAGVGGSPFANQVSDAS